jgi:hypothetical protein
MLTPPSITKNRCCSTDKSLQIVQIPYGGLDMKNIMTSALLALANANGGQNFPVDVRHRRGVKSSLDPTLTGDCAQAKEQAAAVLDSIALHII